MDGRATEVARILEQRRRHSVDDRERASVRSFAAAMENVACPFDQSSSPVHVTSSAVIVDERRDHVVLLLHKRLGIWVQPGGHLDPCEDLAAAALREAAEETGLELQHPDGGPEAIHVDVHPGGRGHTHLDLRWLLIGRGEPAPPPGESPDVRWFAWDDAIATADEGLSGLLRALRPT